MSPHLRSRSSGSDRSCPKAPTLAPGASALEEQQWSPPGLPQDDWLNELCSETSGPDSRNNSLFLLFPLLLLLPLPHLLCLTVCVLVWRLESCHVCLSLPLSSWFFETGSLLNLELANSAGLAEPVSPRLCCYAWLLQGAGVQSQPSHLYSHLPDPKHLFSLVGSCHPLSTVSV